MIATRRTIRVPITSADTCGHRSPRSGHQCRRAQDHTGRHAFFWLKADPGRLRETWEADCQLCGRPTRDGAVCRECGA